MRGPVWKQGMRCLRGALAHVSLMEICERYVSRATAAAVFALFAMLGTALPTNAQSSSRANSLSLVAEPSPGVYGSSVSIQATAAVAGATTTGGTVTYYDAGSAPNYPSSITGGGWALNGSATASGGGLMLTNGTQNNAGAAWYRTPVNVSGFDADFSFTTSVQQGTGDGFTLTFQNIGAGAVGGPGGCLAICNLSPSLALAFDMYGNASGSAETKIGLFADGTEFADSGETDLSGYGLSYQSGDLFVVHLHYDGTTLTAWITDAISGKQAQVISGSNRNSTWIAHSFSRVYRCDWHWRQH